MASIERFNYRCWKRSHPIAPTGEVHPLFRWLAHRFPHVPVHHVASLTVSRRGIHCRRVNGLAEELQWEELKRVLIRTADRGPFNEDLYFILETARFTLWVPQPAHGCDALLQALQQLSNFNNEAVIEATCCTDNEEFLCWRRPTQA